MSRLLGPEHPDTLTAMSNLSVTLQASGDLAGARDLRELLLEARRRLLGPEHPDSTISAWNLLLTLLDLGAQAEARMVLDTHLAWLLQVDPNKLSSSQRQIAQTVGELPKSDQRGARRRGITGIMHRIRGR
jgi:hypothetical protein